MATSTQDIDRYVKLKEAPDIIPSFQPIDRAAANAYLRQFDRQIDECNHEFRRVDAVLHYATHYSWCGEKTQDGVRKRLLDKMNGSFHEFKWTCERVYEHYNFRYAQGGHSYLKHHGTEASPVDEIFLWFLARVFVIKIAVVYRGGVWYTHMGINMTIDMEECDLVLICLEPKIFMDTRKPAALGYYNPATRPNLLSEASQKALASAKAKAKSQKSVVVDPDFTPEAHIDSGAAPAKRPTQNARWQNYKEDWDSQEETGQLADIQVEVVQEMQDDEMPQLISVCSLRSKKVAPRYKRSNSPEYDPIEPVKVPKSVRGKGVKSSMPKPKAKPKPKSKSEAKTRSKVRGVYNGHLAQLAKKKEQKTSYDAWKQHRAQHTADNKCSTCKKGFQSPHLVYKHERKQHGPKRYFCKKCGKGYHYASDVTEHMHVHKTAREKCKHCGAQFRNVSDLRKHARKHAPDAPVFNCPDCKKKFGEKKNLVQHMASHREAALECDKCHRFFKFRSGLQRHNKREHM